MKVSNYTLEFVCPEFTALNKKYLSKMQNSNAFTGFQKIKDDLINFSANENPLIKSSEVEYFEFYWRWPKVEGKADEHWDCFGIDINSAYATILHRDGFISNETFEFILKLPKEDRLACVGMLAARKDIYIYSGGELIDMKQERSELEGYFFYCVQETQKAMRQCKLISNFYTIAHWVDCIYFYHDEFVESILDELKKLGFRAKVDKLKDLTIQDTGKHYKLEFTKEKETKPKFLNFPKTNTNLRQEILKEFNLI